MEEFLDVVRTVAALGFGRVWMGETYKVDPLLVMVRAGEELVGHPLGLGPLPSPLRTGPQLAMAAATLRGLGWAEPVEMLLGASSPTMTEQWHGRGIATPGPHRGAVRRHPARPPPVNAPQSSTPTFARTDS